MKNQKQKFSIYSRCENMCFCMRKIFQKYYMKNVLVKLKLNKRGEFVEVFVWECFKRLIVNCKYMFNVTIYTNTIAIL